MQQQASSLHLPENSIHIWQSNLTSIQTCYSAYWQSLSAAEQARASRFKNAQHQYRHVICHGQLRSLLATYLSVAAKTIEFEIDDFGKPRLKGSKTDQGLVFNISHSGDYALFGFGWQQRLGVDIEIWREAIDMEALTQRCFSKTERHHWHALKANAQPAAFFDLWTRKESFVKAIGRGLSVGLDQCVTATSAPLRYLSVPDSYGVASDWTLVNIECDPGMSAAITTDRPNCHISHHTI